MTREEWCEFAGEEELLFMDPPEEFDHCIIGVTDGTNPVIVYDQGKVLEQFEKNFSDDEDPGTTAREWYDFNVIGAYVGEKTPIYVRRPEEWTT